MNFNHVYTDLLWLPSQTTALGSSDAGISRHWYAPDLSKPRAFIKGGQRCVSKTSLIEGNAYHPNPHPLALSPSVWPDFLPLNFYLAGCFATEYLFATYIDIYPMCPQLYAAFECRASHWSHSLFPETSLHPLMSWNLVRSRCKMAISRIHANHSHPFLWLHAYVRSRNRTVLEKTPTVLALSALRRYSIHHGFRLYTIVCVFVLEFVQQGTLHLSHGFVFCCVANLVDILLLVVSTFTTLDTPLLIH